MISFNAIYGHNRIDHMEQTNKKEIFPSIKLISPKFNIERFFVEEPIEKKMNEGIDLIGRNHSYTKIEIDSRFPQHLSDNREKYKNWIK